MIQRIMRYRKQIDELLAEVKQLRERVTTLESLLDYVLEGEE